MRHEKGEGCYRRGLALHLDAKREVPEVPEIPEITENPEVSFRWTVTMYALLFPLTIVSCLYCFLPLLSRWTIVLSYTIGSTGLLTLLSSLIVLSLFFTRLLYCPLPA